MKDHVSLGSQPQYRPQAASAQIAPQITANVQIGNASAWIRKVVRSRPSASGSRPPSVYGNRTLPSSYPVRTRVSAAATNPTRKIPDAVTAAVTWIFSQYELSAGTSGATFVYSSIPSMPSSTTSTSVTKSPSGRRYGRRVSSTSQAVAPTRHTASTNSYMLPHGTRCAASPRVTRQPRCSSAASPVSASPARPASAATRAFSASPRPAPAGGPSPVTRPDQLPGRHPPDHRPGAERVLHRVGQHGQCVPEDRVHEELVGERGHQRTSFTIASNSAWKPVYSLRASAPAETGPDGGTRNQTRRRRPVSEASSPSIRHQAPPSTTCSPGSYRTDSAVHGRVPRNSTVLPSSSRADSPGRSRSGSGATARSRPVSIWRWSSV